MSGCDAVVVGSGPNGLAAAITLARVGLRVCVIEANETAGGGVRSAALTLPGFVHDVCSAIHPFAVGSPFFQTLELEQFGLEWVYSPAPLAHPLDGGRAAMLERTLHDTGRTLGDDAAGWRRLMGSAVAHFDGIVHDLLGPPRVPRHPFTAADFGARAVLPSTLAGRLFFRGVAARALFAGIAAHANTPLTQPMTASIALVLGAMGHHVGWPFPRGGAARLTEALVECLRAHGGEIVLDTRIRTLADLPPARATLFDVTPRQFVDIAGAHLPARYRRRLERFVYGPAVVKVDYALDGPVPWQAEDCLRAATVHVGGSAPEIAQSEQEVARGCLSPRPYVLVAQHTLFDPSRAPVGRHTLWAYCHVPRAWKGDPNAAADRLEAQLERFAPGFRDRVLHRSVLGPVEMERLNANHIGGSIDGGASITSQLITRPIAALDPYRTPLRGVYLCSSGTPPGPGVHGLCGYHAARSALWHSFR